MNRRQLLKQLTQGSLHNVPFSDIVNLTEGFGFRLARISGSHHIFTNPGISELINLQSVQGDAKPYQIRQLLRLVERYNLRLEEEE
jgi:predicted RNA binding protein YcfA (HicA-like mRNA interferase family)